MELDEFIKKTLTSIHSGIRAANKEILGVTYDEAQKPYLLLSYGWRSEKDKENGFVTFDVAVTAGTELKGTKGGELKVAVVGLGGKSEETSSESKISRIKFMVGVNDHIG